MIDFVPLGCIYASGIDSTVTFSNPSYPVSYVISCDDFVGVTIFDCKVGFAAPDPDNAFIAFAISAGLYLLVVPFLYLIAFAIEE